MKKLITAFAILLFVFETFAQDNKTKLQVLRCINDRGTKGISVNYSFDGINSYQLSANNTAFVRLSIKDFTFLKEVGKPAIPVHYDLILIPEGAQPKVILKKTSFTLQNDLLIYPALQNTTDRYGDPEPEFTIDSAFYQSNIWYPETPVKIIKIIRVKGISLAVVQLCPVQYNPKLRKAKLYHKLNYEVKFTKNDGFIAHKEQYSSYFLKNLSNLILNNTMVKAEIDSYMSTVQKSLLSESTSTKNYIIITHSDYREAADSLAKWKSQLGYSVEIISRSFWNSTQIKSEIRTRYQSWTPKPDYFVIIGDHDKVPGEIHLSPPDFFQGNFATDLYYACMDGPTDYFADMAFGRISVSSATEAMTVVNKIINYEKNPPQQAEFYNNGVVSAFFQDDDTNSCEDRRFVLTMEEIRNYMMNQGLNISRVYKARDSVNPLFYNDGYYANSEPLPNDLKRPTFLWNGSKTNIAAQLNSSQGAFFLAHRDHGYLGGTGWAYPEFTTNDIDLLNNGNNLPVVFSINCYTGEYQQPVCFAEKFLRKPSGGAVGVFGAAFFSYSGFNDGLIEGMFDAIWANPGLIPNFTGNLDFPVGSPAVHQPIYTMGDVMNQGLIRMVQTWGDDQYSHELYHYFGDPAMRIWTSFPDTILAYHDASLDCHDTVFTIDSSNCSHCLATLVVDGELIASDSLNSGPLTLHFPPVAGYSAILTISKHNYRPFTANIPFSAPCIRPRFNIDYSYSCVGQEINYTNTSTGSILTYSWDFGSDAVPQTAANSGPHQVVYSSPGMKIITLTITDATTSATFTDSLYIEQPCVFNTVQNQVLEINSCQGILFDNGGTERYFANSSDTVIISAQGATSVNLHFTDFDVEQGDAGYCNYDYLEIFDGNGTTATLIGKYCSLAGNSPPSVITSSGNTITLHFYSDGFTNGRGYEIDFNCSSSGQIPSAAFVAQPIVSCDGMVSFTDLSTNTPTTFHWDFGDGDTSNTQNPTHAYQANGHYTVSLSAFNAFGSSTFTRSNYITNQRPPAAVTINDTICGPAQAIVSAVADGTIRWFDDEYAGNLLYTGNTFTTPILDTTTTFFAESEINEVFNLGAADTIIGGGFYTGTTSHYLIFDCMAEIKLVSVDVFAGSSGMRTIELRSHANIVLLDTILMLNPGKTTVYLNWNITAGSNYRLVGAGPEFNLYRNISGANYPYTIAGLISITGNSYGNPAYYYYFYNWKIQAEACLSPRTPLTIFVDTHVPVAGYTFSVADNNVMFTNNSVDAYTYLWDFDDATFSELTNPLHTYSTIGTFHVSLTASNSCGDDVFTDTVDILLVGVDENSNINNLAVVPNPANKNVNIKWNSTINDKSLLEITNIFGQQLYTDEISSLEGTNSRQIALTNFAQGVYFVILTTGKQKAVVKLVVI